MSCVLAQDVLGGLHKAKPACCSIFCMRILRHIKRVWEEALKNDFCNSNRRNCLSDACQVLIHKVAPSYLHDRLRKLATLPKDRHEQARENHEHRVKILVKSGVILVRLIRLHSPLVVDRLCHSLATCAF